MITRPTSRRRSFRITRPTLLVAASVVALLVGVPSGGDAVPDPSIDPGAFWPLAVGHRGDGYRDDLPSGSWRLASGRLPRGLSISGGDVVGTPSETGTFSAILSGNGRLRVSVTVREQDERGLGASAPSFEGSGPFETGAFLLEPEVVSTFDGRRVETEVLLTLPFGTRGDLPLLLFHRGRGFDHDSYMEFHAQIASWGIAVASVEDRPSFAGASFRATVSAYDRTRAELGMESASGIVEAVGDRLLQRSADSTDPLSGWLDPDNVFMAGHSRGGGATHASHQRSQRLRYKGLIYLMPFDLRFFRETRPPGTSPAYGIDATQPRTPSLIVVAENDGDLSYPIADQLIDRASGPATQVTLYGGVHNLISDSHPSEGQARIGRSTEQRRVADWIICFVRRWALDDASLEGRLYGDVHQDSRAYAVASWRPTARTLLVEDAQDRDAARNRLGGNLVAGLRRREQSFYPSVGDLPNLGLRHTHLTPTDQVSAWRMAFDRPQDVDDHARVSLRVAQTSNAGWSWVTLWLRMIDAEGNASLQRIHSPGGTGVLPRFDGLSSHERFIDVHVDLDAFRTSAGSAGAVDRSRLVALDLFLVIEDGRNAGSVIVDTVRFE